MTKPQMSRGLLRSAAVICVSAMFVVACSNNGSTSSPTNKTGSTTPQADEAGGLYPESVVNKAVHTGTPSRGGTLQWGLESAVLDVSPNQSPIQPSDVQMAAAVFAPLVSYGDQGEFNGVPVTNNTNHAYNQLADSITSPGDDLIHWTLKLRPGVKFSDGNPVTAQEVVDETKWAQASTNCSCANDAQQIADVTASDDLTVNYTLKAPVVDWPAKLTGGGLGWITEKSARDAAPNPASPDIMHLIGAGPFAYQSQDGDTYTVVANKNYFGVDTRNDNAKLPYLEKIVFKPMADSVTRLQGVQSNGVQMIQTADTSNLVGAKADSSLNVQPAEGTSSTILVVNLLHPPFGVTPKPGETAQQTAIRSLNDPTALKARQAFNYLINRNEINQKYYKGTRVPSYGMFPQSNVWYDPNGNLPRFDQAKAQSLVNQVKKADGKFDIHSICIATPESTGVNQIITQQAQAVGVSATLKQLDQAVLVNTMLSGAGNIQWDSSCFRDGQLADPDGMYNGLITGGPTNITKYSRSNVDTWLKEGRATSDTAKRKQIYDNIQQQVAKDVVIIPLVFDYWGNVFRKNVSGLSTPSPDSLGIIDPGTLYYIK